MLAAVAVLGFCEVATAQGPAPSASDRDQLRGGFLERSLVKRPRIVIVGSSDHA